ncbi:hypothetical protein AN478_05940 [Thiohalorhabdus denitrificans]|uniref:Barrel-sandwich domain of CusB or HlyD membrane-fusion n=1 Tax=Thiohalorhabdus denitrificans TaxID=381306 RepID=A0A0P9CCT3_9GAMM|nr:efflux RND transporter periplasmic adaptor subunit [Thiohalorhabdus denitrificans]KPV40695.1 hypothetical protein AN478_05940 [Thiohalorhabdus denitrificans]SCY46727.1 Barrel-sandwich domain of CusB or HlyD membrane-fusion [Thiohalorhabdus denitrificans]
MTAYLGLRLRRFLLPLLLFSGVAAGGSLDDARRYPGQVVFDERGQSSVSIRVNAQITDLADITRGSQVQSGDPLVWFESAELRTVQSSYLSTYRNSDFQRLSYQSEQTMARNRLILRWRGLSKKEIEELELDGEPLEEIALEAPFDGVVLGLDVVKRQVVNAGVQVGQFTAVGMPALSLADPDRVLVEAQVPGTEARRMAAGDPAHVHAAAGVLEGEVVGVYPQAVEGSGRHRVVVETRKDAVGSGLVPGMRVGVAVSLRSEPVSRWEQRGGQRGPTGDPRSGEGAPEGPPGQPGAPAGPSQPGQPGQPGTPAGPGQSVHQGGGGAAGGSGESHGRP